VKPVVKDDDWAGTLKGFNDSILQSHSISSGFRFHPSFLPEISLGVIDIQPLRGCGIHSRPLPPVAPVAIHIQPLRGFSKF